MVRRAVLAFAAAAAFVAGLRSAGAQQRVFRPDDVYRVPIGRSASRGPADAPVTIVEFSDFRCGACRHAHPIIRQLLALYPGQIRFVYKNYVIFGEASLLASLAALAAGEQGEFWAMHDRLFAAEDTDFTVEQLDRFARDIGLDMARWRAQMRERRPAALATLLEENALAERLGLGSTPMFFVNGRPVAGAADLGTFIRLVDDEIKRARWAIQDGAPRDRIYEALTASGRERGRSAWPVGIGSNGLVRGNPNALVTLVVFEDFQCPFCARHAQVIDQLAREYGDDLRIVFRHMPLRMHAQAQLAHEASMAAAAQGKFWAYHDRLFSGGDLDRDALIAYAKQIGLDVRRFRAALDRHEFAAAVAADVAAAQALGITGTPTSFVNGQRVDGAQPIGVFRTLIDQKRAEARALLDRGVSRDALYRTIVDLDDERGP